MLASIILLMLMFWNKYKLDINLYIANLKSSAGIEKMLTVKAHDFINRLSYCYNNNHSINKIDNYFDKNCDISLSNSSYIYSKDIRSNILETLKHRSKSNQDSMLIIFPTRSGAKIINFDDDEVTVEVEGYYKVLSNHEFFSDKLKETEEVSYKYSVTFKKKFLFVWKATNFETESDVIENLMNGLLERPVNNSTNAQMEELKNEEIRN